MRRMLLPVLLGLLSLSLAAPVSSASTSSPSPAPAGSADRGTTLLSPATFEARLLTRVNKRRAARGCRLLRTHSALVRAARGHSDLMASRRQLSHRLAGEPTFDVRITRAGYTGWRLLAENLATGQPTPRAVVRSWVNSAPHRANLDNCRLRDVGFGVSYSGSRSWVTADLGRRR